MSANGEIRSPTGTGERDGGKKGVVRRKYGGQTAEEKGTVGDATKYRRWDIAIGPGSNADRDSFKPLLSIERDVGQTVGVHWHQ
jgi:hypothetical protein